MKHGEHDGKGGRWCTGCNCAHGSMYVCEHYGAALKAGIDGSAAKLRNNLRDPAWCDEQVKQRGIPESALQIMGAFAGVVPRSGKPS